MRKWLNEGDLETWGLKWPNSKWPWTMFWNEEIVRKTTICNTTLCKTLTFNTHCKTIICNTILCKTMVFNTTKLHKTISGFKIWLRPLLRRRFHLLREVEILRRRSLLLLCRLSMLDVDVICRRYSNVVIYVVFSVEIIWSFEHKSNLFFLVLAPKSSLAFHFILVLNFAN